jgi:exosortase
LLTGYGIWPGQNDFVWDVGMVVTLFGIVLTLCGWQVMRIAWFPIVFLLCAIPWPPLVYSQMAIPLQKIAAISSVAIMNLVGVEASHGGSKIFIAQYDPSTGKQIADRALNVAEACAGLVSLMTFISIAGAVAFLSSRSLWQKLVITASAVPIAIFCNVLRVAGVGLLDKYAGRDWSEGFAHQFAGMVLLLPAFLLIMLVCWIVDQMVIEEADDEETPATTSSKPAGGAA